MSVQSLAVQSTTLDDVFVHYTGRQLRDALAGAVGGGPIRAWSIAADRSAPCIAPWPSSRRELRRFRRSPMLIVMSLVMPIVQLVVLGYAFGGQVKNLEGRGRRSGSRRARGAAARALERRLGERADVRRRCMYTDLGRRSAICATASERRARDPARFFAPRRSRATIRTSRSSRTIRTTS